MTDDRAFLEEAVRLSRCALRTGRGGPFGAVIVQDEAVIARGANRVTIANDPTAHAEVVAIRRACRVLGRFELSDCVLYSSCEPCPMCLAAALWARLSRIVHASTRADAAFAGFDDQAFYRELALPPARRRLRMKHLALPEARAVFEDWRRLPGRIRY